MTLPAISTRNPVKAIRCLAPILLLFALTAAGGRAQADPPIYSPSTGHCYEILTLDPPLSWCEARDAAATYSFRGAPSHLVTVGSQAETDFLLTAFPQIASTRAIPLGGRQPVGSSEPDGDWEWITAEPWDYTNWHAGEPNNSGFYNMENALAMVPDGTWNDVAFEETYNLLVVEYDTVVVSDVSRSEYTTATLEAGAPVYNDRDYTFAGPIPPELEGLTYIRTLNDDKTTNTAFSFTVDQPVVVYWVLDTRGYDPSPISSISLPWGYGWEPATSQLHVTEIHPARRILWKRFPDGEVRIERNLGSSNNQISMYSIIIGQPDVPPNPDRRIYNSDNGHLYEMVHNPNGWIWPEAKLDAESRRYRNTPGHLATLTSAAERDFVLGEIFMSWQADAAFLGGFQPDGSPEPDGGWKWVTGEAWSFTDWTPREPNNSGSHGAEDVLELIWRNGMWNDCDDTHNTNVFSLVEYEPPAIISIANAGYKTDVLWPRKPVFADAPNRFYEPIPEFLRGLAYIQTLKADSDSRSTDTLRFTVDRDVVVYVAHEARYLVKPSWLNDWMDTGQYLVTDLTCPRHRIYAKRFPAGEVVLEGNRDATLFDPDMYSVLVGPSNELPMSTQPKHWMHY